jgi:hypothetical protein
LKAVWQFIHWLLTDVFGSILFGIFVVKFGREDILYVIALVGAAVMYLILSLRKSSSKISVTVQSKTTERNEGS